MYAHWQKIIYINKRGIGGIGLPLISQVLPSGLSSLSFEAGFNTVITIIKEAYLTE